VNSRRDSASLTSACSNSFELNSNKTNKIRTKKNLLFFDESDNHYQEPAVKSKYSNKQTYSQKPILSKSKSEIFAAKTKPLLMSSSSSSHSSKKRLQLIQHQQSENSTLSRNTHTSETNILRRRNVFSSPKLSVINSDDSASKQIQKIKHNQKTNIIDKKLMLLTNSTENIADNLPFDEKLPAAQYLNSPFFLPSDKSDTTGSTDTEDNEIEEDAFSSLNTATAVCAPTTAPITSTTVNVKQMISSDVDLKQINKKIFINEEEDEYDLNEGDDLSDSDQTESCILNDANNNDLLEYTNDLASNKMRHNSANDSDSELAPADSASVGYKNVLKTQDMMNDENNNEKVKKYRSVCFFWLLNFLFKKDSLRISHIKTKAHVFYFSFEGI
jgi:hypothetical protein